MSSIVRGAGEGRCVTRSTGSNDEVGRRCRGLRSIESAIALDLGALVGLDHPRVLGVELGHELVALLVGVQQLRDHAGRAARVGDVHDRARL